MLTEFKNAKQIIQNFKTEQDCIKYLESKLWINGEPTCPICNGHDYYNIKDGRYSCKKCRKHYNVKKNTIFDNSNISLITWFEAIIICKNSKKGISSVQIAKELGITQKSAWFLMMRIRETFDVQTEKLNNIVEVSTTELVSKYPHKNVDGKAHVLSIVGMVERGNNTVLMKNSDTISNIENTVSFDSVIVTNNSPVFNNLNYIYPEHEVVGLYPTNIFHLNNVRNRFSITKSTIRGTHSFVSNKHLNKYCIEIAGKQNNTVLNFKKVLRYKNLIN